MEKLKIIPLGGFNKLGMNMTVFEYGDDIVVIDCGASFPQNKTLGIDTTIPDISYLRENKEKIRGVVLTHAHEDHIGAVPYIIPDFDVPLYGTPLTIALVQRKMISRESKEKIRTKVIRQGNTIKLGVFKIEFIQSNHSIPDSVMLAVYTPAGVVICTGDFKVDFAPVIGGTIDLQRLAMLGYKGVLAVLSDSTNSMREGISESEAMVREKIESLFNHYRSGRLIVSTFASNMDRVQQIIEIASGHNRKVILQGEDMKNIFFEAQKLGYISVPENTLIANPTEKECEDDNVVFIIAGQHGESLSILDKIARGDHELIKARANDTLIFSSIQVNGYEEAFSRTINSLETQGVHIVSQSAHATGHACAEELKLLYSLVKPQYVIPAHGEFRQRRASGKLAEMVGVTPSNVILMNDGDMLEISGDKAEIIGSIPTGEVIVDAFRAGDISRRELQEREQIGDNGLIIIELCFGAKSQRLLSAPSIVSKGFMDSKKKRSIMDGIYKTIMKQVGMVVGKPLEKQHLKGMINYSVGEFLWETIQRRPMIVTLITEIEEL